MAIVGIGTDIVSVERIRRVLTKTPEFAQRILTPDEMRRLDEQHDTAAFVAKRFAAKEAAAKALGTGIGKVSFQDIFIEHTASGQPLLRFRGEAQVQAGYLGARSYHVSISDEHEFAVAYVVLEGN